MRTRRELLQGLGGVTIALIVSGCDPAPDKGKEGTTTPGKKATEGGNGGKPLFAGIVMDVGGPDDKSFNAAANLGLTRAIAELKIDSKSKYLQSKSPADYKQNLTSFATQGASVIIAVGFAMAESLKEVAPQFPGVKFVIVDADAPKIPNAASLRFKEEQGCFMAGYLAASMSKTKTIGFVGGVEIPLIKKFEAGYKAGAKTADPAVQVKVTYTGDWDALDKGKSQADQLFANGADIIFHAAGKAGLGVIRAAEAKGAGFYAIGVDQDQDAEAPGRVLTSMVKRVDLAVFDTIKAVQDGQFVAGERMYDITKGGVGLSEMKYTKKDVPVAVMAKLDKIKAMLGATPPTIVAPTTLAELDTFVVPKID